jgi:hypothetical protein
MNSNGCAIIRSGVVDQDETVAPRATEKVGPGLGMGWDASVALISLPDASPHERDRFGDVHLWANDRESHIRIVRLLMLTGATLR